MPSKEPDFPINWEVVVIHWIRKEWASRTFLLFGNRKQTRTLWEEEQNEVGEEKETWQGLSKCPSTMLLLFCLVKSPCELVKNRHERQCPQRDKQENVSKMDLRSISQTAKKIKPVTLGSQAPSVAQAGI